ncbi:macrophage mannose receptor 1-like [Pangasianodon hypophthalmus]|uniref:macrophage mannose receptor 1-like n=1 Tax=Pangasianodon hypophthalmus TaxID=310915 RepID=UPI002307A473|nr:macrophage mannose receptor 1-like [Pangasianodon hypophthalmus]
MNKLATHTLGGFTLFAAPVKSMRNITGMTHKWVFVILFFSVCGIGAYIPHRYHFVNENKNWSEAQTYCREKYTDLATINNMEEMKKLNHTLKKETAEQAWIGLQREGTGKWQWSLTDQTFYRDGNTYRNWSSTEPNNCKKNEFCVMMSKSNGFWFDVKCNKTLPFVCYEEKNTNTNRHILINETKTWYDAQTYCREKYTDLVSVRNKTENEEIWRVIQNSPNKTVWIGLFNNSWKWSDQIVCGVGAYIPHRYHFVNENKNWSEAQTYCREKYTDLATINNMEEMKKLNHTLKKETVKQAWIGLQREGTGEWQWSLADQTFYRDGDTYRNWDSGEPENDTNTNRHILIKETKTWYDAQTYCREKHIDLVSVRNKTENEEIWRVIQNETVWIGLFNNSWKWSDQSNSSFRYWSSDKPSGCLNCTAVSVSEQHYWSDVNCKEKLPFICHENKLILIKENLTWKEALRYCRNHHYDLVSVRTEEMQLWVKEVARNASTEHVWLGLRHTCALGFWYWVTGEMICYQDWAPGNGTGFEDCSNEERTGAVQSGGEQQWISLPQSYTLNFICSTYEG